MKFLETTIILITSFTLAQVILPATSLSFGIPATRRAALGCIAGVATSGFTGNQGAHAEGQLANKVDVDRFLKTGLVSNPMGISGQGSKSRPETGVLLRDGSEVERDTRTGDVSAEILLKDDSGKPIPVIASFRSEEWPLATGLFYDVECRDSKTGDGVFLAVTPDTKGKSIGELKDSFIINSLFGPMGRFSAYGEPTDIQVHESATQGNRLTMEVSFSTLSQSTQTEIPRHAKLYAVIPEGTRQAVMLVGSSSAMRWKKGSDMLVATVGDSFHAILAPPTSLKMRAKPRPTVDVVV